MGFDEGTPSGRWTEGSTETRRLRVALILVAAPRRKTASGSRPQPGRRERIKCRMTNGRHKWRGAPLLAGFAVLVGLLAGPALAPTPSAKPANCHAYKVDEKRSQK